jgi:hypothetical protein
MSEKHTPDKMLMRLLRVAEILAKAEYTNLSKTRRTNLIIDAKGKSQRTSTEHTKS